MSEKKKPSTPPKKDPVPIPDDLPGTTSTVPPIRTPEIELPPYNPPVPNRAWTAMKDGLDKMSMGELTTFTERERRGLYMNPDDNF